MSLKLIIDGVILIGVHKDELANEAEELDARIASCRETLMMLAASSPRSVNDVEGNPIDWVDYIQSEVNQVFEDLQEAMVNKHLVMVAMEDLDAVKETF